METEAGEAFDPRAGLGPAVDLGSGYSRTREQWYLSEGADLNHMKQRAKDQWERTGSPQVLNMPSGKQFTIPCEHPALARVVGVTEGKRWARCGDCGDAMDAEAPLH